MRIIDDPDVKQALLDGQPYDISITVTPSGGSAVSIDADHISENGISINPSSVSGNKLELGSVISATADITFFNYDGTLDNVVFAGSEIYIQGSMTVNGLLETFDIGYFIADTVNTTGPRILVKCFDRMIKLDQPANLSAFSLPMEMYDIAKKCCTLCGITLATAQNTLPNNDLFVRSLPSGTPTYRQIVGWAAALMGRCARINNKGQMELAWYTAADWNADLDHRFDGGEVARNAVTTTGIKVIANGTTVHTEGADGYTIDITDNVLLSEGDLAFFAGGFWYPASVSTVMSGVWSDIGSITYYPARTDIVSNVIADVFDIIDYTDDDETVKSVAVTDVVYNLSARTAMESKGATEEEATYAPQDPFTPSQSTQLADASRLKIGRIESTDESIYFDLNTGDIHTENETDRITGEDTESHYKTNVDFKDGELAYTIVKDGTEIGSITMGVNGLAVVMDESQGYSFPKPAGYDTWSSAQKQLWWFAHRLVMTVFDANNVVNNSISVTDKDTSTYLKQSDIASNEIQIMKMDQQNNKGDRSVLTPDGLEVQKLVYTPGQLAPVVTKSVYGYDTASVRGTLAVLTGIKIGSADYMDANAKPVATEEYVQNYIASLLGDYIVANGTTLNWEWRQWQSGKIECWRSYPVTVPANSFVQGTVAWHYDTEAPFPTDMFSAAPRIQITAQTSTSQSYSYWVGTSGAVSLASKAVFRLYRETAVTTDITCYCHIYAIGTVGPNWAP